MKKMFAVGLVVLGSLYLPHAQAAPKIIEGTISDYQCGDNCYLSVVDTRGKEYSGLCTAKLCDKWNENGDMPASFKGRKVKVTVGRANQYNGEGQVMGKTDAFSKIELLK